MQSFKTLIKPKFILTDEKFDLKKPVTIKNQKQLTHQCSFVVVYQHVDHSRVSVCDLDMESYC